MYLAEEGESEGEGLYEMRPLYNQSLLYSQLKAVLFHSGSHQSRFLLTYGNSTQHKKLTG